MENLNLDKYKLNLKAKTGVFNAGKLDLGTSLLLNTLQTPLDHTVIADLGSGSGVVGMALARLNPRSHIHLLDSDIRSINLATENVDKNRLRNVEIFLSDLFSAVSSRTYSQIYSNPPQSMGNDFLEETLKESILHLKPKGEIIWVVKSNLKVFIEKLFDKHLKRVEIIASNKGYIVIKGRK
jgi:16S rRNA (guanine1207-N2)-methyltransferase